MPLHQHSTTKPDLRAPHASASARFTFMIAAGWVLLNALVIGMLAHTAQVNKLQFIESSKIVGLNLVKTMEKGLDAKVAILRASQSMMVASLESELATGAFDPSKLQHILALADKQANQRQALRIYDHEGKLAMGQPLPADGQHMAPPSIADRDFFIEAKAHPDKPLIIGRFAPGHHSTEMTMIFAAPFRHPDGRFAGVVTTRLGASIFDEMVKDLKPNQDDAFVIRDSRDYSLLARQPQMLDKPGGVLGSKNIPKNTLALIKQGERKGTAVVQDTTDGIVRTSCFSILDHYPIIVIAAIGHNGHMAPWFKQVESFKIFGASFLILSLAIAFFFWRSALRAIAAENMANELNASLEQQVAERGIALEAARQAERAAQKELADAERLASLGSMVAGVAHELNTPLGNSLLSSSALAEQSTLIAHDVANGTIKRSELIRKLENLGNLAALQAQSIERAAELVQSFKLVAVDQASGKRRQFDLKQTIDSVVTSLRPTLSRSETPIDVVVSIDEGIRCDTYPGALIQIATNMIQNAWRHAFEGRARGTLSIHARFDPIKPSMVHLHFIDDGVGMSPEAWDRIFEPYFTTKADQGGTGVGLSLSKQLATTVLGGALAAHAGPGGGMDFELSFPRDRLSEPGDADPTAL